MFFNIKIINFFYILVYFCKNYGENFVVIIIIISVIVR